jgi:hypothetical protein
MKGIELFKAHFKDYLDNYIVIGGAACEDVISGQGLIYRSTKDIDMILIVEALSDKYIEQFWKFIELGQYENYQIGEEEKKYYRFHKPKNEEYPFMIELFSRKPDVIKLPKGMTYTPIPANEDLSSLSAILMDDAYYNYTLSNTSKGGTFHRASNLSLICLKAKAFLDLSARKADGQHVNSNDIKKHKLDIFRLSATLNSNELSELPDSIKVDLEKFIGVMEKDPPQLDAMLKHMGIAPIESSELLEQLRLCFGLNP